MRPRLIYGVYRASAIAAHAHVLQVEKIIVRGNERLSKGEVLAVLNGLRGENLMWTDLDRWRTRLMASPWVRDAALRRSLPSTVEVVVSERQPIGIGRIHSDMYLVDERGVIIDQYGPQYADLDLPIIDGLSAAPGDGGALTDEGRADLAARVIAAVKSKPSIARRLSQVDVSDLHNAVGDPQRRPRDDSARRGPVSGAAAVVSRPGADAARARRRHRLRRPALRRPHLRAADEDERRQQARRQK